MKLKIVMLMKVHWNENGKFSTIQYIEIYIEFPLITIER